jgi:hypothetical protein
MSVSPIAARCRRCADDFFLFELLDIRDGNCPRCGWSLTRDWTEKLLEEARRADAAQLHLVRALRAIRALPGNVVPRPSTVLRNLFEEVRWQEDLIADPILLEDELEEIRRQLWEWELLDPLVAAAEPRRNWLRRALRWLVGGDGRPSRRWPPIEPIAPGGPVAAAPPARPDVRMATSSRR